MSINFDNFNNIVSMFFEQAKKMKDKPYLWKKNNDNFESLSWGEVELSVKSVERSYIPINSVIRIDEVIESGEAKIKENKSQVSPLPINIQPANK